VVGGKEVRVKKQRKAVSFFEKRDQNGGECSKGGTEVLKKPWQDRACKNVVKKDRWDDSDLIGLSRVSKKQGRVEGRGGSRSAKKGR